jgi:phosphinothricin acetyltransferase
MIRTARESDAPGIQAIYAPVVSSTPISFEYEVPTVEEMASRVRKILPEYPWLVCERDGKIAGYAYASQYRTRAAYQWSAEVTVYVHEGFRRHGIARKLYEALFGYLREAGYTTAVAGITLPNPASVAAHEALGFRKVGAFEKLGYKQGAWYDVGFWQLKLQPERQNPKPPKPWANRAVTCTD